jgi:hypothetical protein
LRAMGSFQTPRFLTGLVHNRILSFSGKLAAGH